MSEQDEKPSFHMAAGGFLQYKCRRCGVRKNGVRCPQPLTDLMELLRKGNLNRYNSFPVYLTNICFCRDGGLGVADIIGVVLDKENKPDEAPADTS